MISDVRFYLKLLARRFPAMAVLIVLSSCVGYMIAQRLPTMYLTSAQLSVDPPQIASDLVQSTVQANIAEQLQLIQQRMLTRANLIDIATDVDVFPNRAQMTADEIVQAMRGSTTISRAGGRNRATVMTISFEGPDPQKVADVVNRFVSIVLEESSDIRTGSTEGTLSFFEALVRRHADALDTQSAKIVAFKNANTDALPENLPFRTSRQSTLTERLSRTEREIESLEARRENIQRVYDSTGQVATPQAAARTPEQAQLQRLESELRVALSVYSEQNPRVKSLQAQIEALRAEITALSAAAPVDAENEQDVVDPQRAALDVNLAEIDAQLGLLRQDVTNITAELASLQDTIERTPANAITLAAMERDLSNIERLYSTALARLQVAQMGEQVEDAGGGERITILEAASVPTTPSSPNRKAIIGIGVAIGLALAAGLFLLLELLNQSIRRPADIIRALEITPLATVPRIESAGRRRMRRAAQFVTLVIVLAGVPTALWMIDTYYLPLDLLYERLIGRIGLT